MTIEDDHLSQKLSIYRFYLNTNLDILINIQGVPEKSIPTVSVLTLSDDNANVIILFSLEPYLMNNSDINNKYIIYAIKLTFLHLFSIFSLFVRLI